MKFRRSLQLLLAIALLVAWQGALLHPLEHVNAAGGYVHLADGHEPKNSGSEKSGAAPPCDAVAAVAICIGTAQPVPIVSDSYPGLLPESSGSATRSAPGLAYRSQAPPSLL